MLQNPLLFSGVSKCPFLFCKAPGFFPCNKWLMKWLMKNHSCSKVKNMARASFLNELHLGIQLSKCWNSFALFLSYWSETGSLTREAGSSKCVMKLFSKVTERILACVMHLFLLISQELNNEWLLFKWWHSSSGLKAQHLWW